MKSARELKLAPCRRQHCAIALLVFSLHRENENVFAGAVRSRSLTVFKFEKHPVLDTPSTNE